MKRDKEFMSLLRSHIERDNEFRRLRKASRLELLDSALHAPQAGFGDKDFYPSVTQKAAVLAVRIARIILYLTATSVSPGRR